VSWPRVQRQSRKLTLRHSVDVKALGAGEWSSVVGDLTFFSVPVKLGKDGVESVGAGIKANEYVSSAHCLASRCAADGQHRVCRSKASSRSPSTSSTA